MELEEARILEHVADFVGAMDAPWLLGVAKATRGSGPSQAALVRTLCAFCRPGPSAGESGTLHHRRGD
eukprot:13610818-Alexandrium_andersonii.AAC.1